MCVVRSEFRHSTCAGRHISRRIQGRAISLTLLSLFFCLFFSRDRSRITHDANTLVKRTYDDSPTRSVFCQSVFLRSASVSFDIRINSFELSDIISWLGGQACRGTEDIKLRLRYGDRDLSQSFRHVRLSAAKRETTEMWINISKHSRLIYFVFIGISKRWYQNMIAAYSVSFVIVVTNIISWYIFMKYLIFFFSL